MARGLWLVRRGGFVWWSVGVRKDDPSPTILVPGCRLCGLGAGVESGYAAECVLGHVCRFMIMPDLRNRPTRSDLRLQHGRT